MPIGVFDSGVGGLTVLRALRLQMPRQNFLYLGDTARLPYGTKSATTVIRYSQQCAAQLVERGIKALVVACNTASASALPALREAHPQLPIIGVIEPGAAEAVRVSESGRIAVIGTQATIDGGAYEASILRIAPAARVSTRACALLVALAEEGWVDGPIAEGVARRYLADWFDGAAAPDTLVLGCTHFPQLLDALRAAVPPRVHLVDSARTTALWVQQALGSSVDSASPHVTPADIPSGTVRWLATDGAARFARVGARFLGHSLSEDEIEIIDL